MGFSVLVVPNPGGLLEVHIILAAAQGRQWSGQQVTVADFELFSC